jgi:hypothetical protein
MSPTRSSPALGARALLLSALLAAGCATPASQVQADAEAKKQDWKDGDPATRPNRFDPNLFASQFVRPADCERSARELQLSSRERAWAGLKACVNRGNFLLLRLLANSAWAHDLQTRPEAPELLTRLVARRGGAVLMDLSMLQEQRVPIFTLSDAVDEPELYKGRYVMFRAKVNERRSEGRSLTARLEETVLKSEAFEYPVGLAYRSSSVTRIGGNVRGRPFPGEVSGNVTISRDSSSYASGRKFDNVVVETGREALVRLPEADPFLQPGKEFIVLARFDGVRTTASSAADDDPEMVPVLTLITFHPPGPLVIY